MAENDKVWCGEMQLSGKPDEYNRYETRGAVLGPASAQALGFVALVTV